MEGRFFVVGLMLAAYAWGARRWGADRPRAWRRAFAVLVVASLGVVFLGHPDESAAATAVGGVVAMYLMVMVERGKEGSESDPLAEPISWAKTFAAAALGEALIVTFLVQPCRIRTSAMEDTFKAGDFVFANKVVYGLRSPFSGRRLPARPGAVRRGDLLAFRFPSDDPSQRHCKGRMAGKGFLMRVVGVGGDVVEMRGGAPFLNGTPVGAEPYVKDPSPAPGSKSHAAMPSAEYQRAWEERRLEGELGEGLRDQFGPVTVPPGSYFVLGDNRDDSCDSRFWGPVPNASVLGRGSVLYWPPNRFRPL